MVLPQIFYLTKLITGSAEASAAAAHAANRGTDIGGGRRIVHGEAESPECNDEWSRDDEGDAELTSGDDA